MKVSILISSYNGKEHLARLLDSIQRLHVGDHEIEVILRDDHSSDDTVEEISQHYHWVTLLQGEERLGFVKSSNIAFRHASGEVLCCVNQDTILDAYYLLEGLTLLEIRPDVVGINTNMIMPWVLSLEAFNASSRETLPAYEYQLTHYGFTRYAKVDPGIAKTNFLTGGGFFLRRSALAREEDLFDPRINMYCEDTDLALRLMKSGGNLLYNPKAILYHNQTTRTLGSLAQLRKLIMITWNRLYVLSKHHPPLSFFRNFPFYIYGIVRKMDYLGLPNSRKVVAYFVASCLTFPFALSLPYWLRLSHSYHRKEAEISTKPLSSFKAND